ncbi:MAG: protein translocase subunit SecD [Candidatus Cloacimonetes bacterium]|nr:protein translocase subunit SecD [Candidatus Cloacimonadota bacterium]MCF7814390.1 protein translocase subunit SecD [Candidatus Cloacimonadota bacterium]MCF7868530.1 protein translocase subunit SecD [Candidatus Cloacimonadota bacterium]MCF7884050.1 protein translocase subunit SecD [Candidatus Cloacimonadota bacterium]
MKNSKIRGLIIVAVLLVTAYFFAPLVVPNLPSFWTEKELRLGLDLQGGSQIQLEVDFSELTLSQDDKEDAVKTAYQIIRNRIDQFGVAEPIIQRVGTTNRIILQLPGLDDPSRAKNLIGKTALLEFKLLADGEQYEEATKALDRFLQDNLDQFEELKPFADITTEEVTDVLESEEEEEVEGEEAEEDNLYIFTNLTTSSNDEPYTVDYENLALLKKLLKNEDFKNALPAGLQLAVGREDANDPYKARQIYVLKEKSEITGKYLEKAQTKIGQGYAPKDQGPYILLTFNKAGARIFKNVTGQHINERLAILLDDIVYIAPTIQSRIPSGEARITGQFTIEEVQDLVIVLNAGSLPAPVKIIEERTVGPTLGSDSIRAGMMAAIIGLAIVFIFMIFYYGLSGLIADIAVAVNVIFILAVLTMFEATLTMPGIAGVILTIGMAVDANVIIFERIRENLHMGKTVRTAVDGGFSRALVTILDANITTLITALVLYQFGTGPIRGFAVTLSIGIVGSMFASIVLAKAIFDGFVTNVARDKLSI